MMSRTPLSQEQHTYGVRKRFFNNTTKRLPEGENHVNFRYVSGRFGVQHKVLTRIW